MNNSMVKNRIVWFLDSTLANVKPENWEMATNLARKLVQEVGSPDFDHELILPQQCWRELAQKLMGQNFSTVIDLTGWLTPSLRELFPRTQVENFRISRVHTVSSLKLDKSGFMIGNSRREIEELRKFLDLSHVLIIDDVAFSGRTIKKVIELWGIKPEKASLGFLVANTGNFGEGKTGPVEEFESKGTKVIFAREVQTPQDDGFHFGDLLAAANPEQAFILSVLIQELAQSESHDSPVVKRVLESSTIVKTLFPEALTTQDVIKLKNEDKFIALDSFSERRAMLHSPNPIAWVIPSFVKRSNPQLLIGSKDKISSHIRELQDISDPLNQLEAAEEFARETRELIGTQNIENRLLFQKER